MENGSLCAFVDGVPGDQILMRHNVGTHQSCRKTFGGIEREAKKETIVQQGDRTVGDSR
jgi:hypothetical protein